MSDYTYLDGDYNGEYWKEETLEVNVIGENEAWVSDAELHDAYRGIRNALDQAWNSSYTDFEGTIARKYRTDYSLDYYDYWGSARDWIDDHGFGDGVYLWVCWIDAPGVARAGGGWGDNELAFVNSHVFQGENLASVAVQEGLHPYLLDYCANVQALIDGSAHGDHALGEVWNQWSDGQPTDEASPMCYTYVGDGAAADGDCGYYDDLEEGGTWRLTNCTELALEYSKNHHVWFH